MFRDFFASLSIETLKIRRSMIFWITIGASCFIALVLGLMMVLVKNPEILPPGILKTKVTLSQITADWPSYISFSQIASGAVGIILFGFAVSWIFGREYNDRTLKDMLALPVSRSIIVYSKLIAVSLWCILLSVIMFIVAVVLGMLIQLPLGSTGLLLDFSKIFFITTLLSLLLCPPAAFAASAGRSILPAIGFVILCTGLANLFGNIGLGAYFPWTIPMLYTGAIGTIGNRLPLSSFIILIITSITGTLGTVMVWKYADQNK